jgi:superfamily II DNA or RNA helicase
MKIEIVNTIESRTDDQGAKHLAAILSYTSSYWRKGQWGMKRYEYQKPLIKRAKDGYSYFLTGFVPRIAKQFPSATITTMFTEPNDKFGRPILVPEGFTFRPDQLKLMAQAIAAKRGLVQSPTGSGKTILQLGIISAMPKGFCCLILAHTKDIVTQTYDELCKFGFKAKTQMIMEGHRPPLTKPIVVATIQTFTKYSVDDYMTYFDMVMVDEGHHISNFDGPYYQVLSTLLAPYRFAFTATRSPNKEAEMALEGLMGPVVAKLTINAAASLNIIAKPKLRLIKLPENHSIRQTCRNYDEVVKHGIVGSVARTEKICNLVENGVKHGKVTLVMVNQIEHGNKIQAELKARGLSIPFVQGVTDGLERVRIKNQLISKKLLAAICTGVWSEGINIVSINTIILAHLGKSELKTLQNIGRGLRRSDEKDTVTIVDFYDPSHNHLIRHFGERLCLYFDFNWV